MTCIANRVFLYMLLPICIGFAAGFLIGKTVTTTHVEITQKPGKQSSGAVIITDPVEVRPDIPTLPMIVISGHTVVDTAAIIADYETQKKYNLIAFDDDKGKLELFPTVQYNKLTDLSYTFTPIVQIVRKEKVWQLFASASYSTGETFGIGGGVFYHKLGFEYQYQFTGHSLGVKYIFQ